MLTISILIAAFIIELLLKPRLDWDKLNKQLFLWFNGDGRRKYIKLYEQSSFN